MGKFVINGGKKLNGSVKIESAKNSVLPILAGSILTDEKVVIKNCPKIKDVLVMIKIVVSAGEFIEKGSRVRIEAVEGLRILVKKI